MFMLVSFKAEMEYQRGDVDQNGRVDIADVSCLIGYLLSGDWNDEVIPPDEEHEWVDLGLPSGTLWATCNIGANSPEEYGDYFAWGEITPKGSYGWTNYKWCNGAKNKITKYCTNRTYGTVDNLRELELEDDAAYMNWGPSWRMPTYTQLMELKNNCSSTWTTMNGIKGRLFTGPNGNKIFFPAAGKKPDSSPSTVGVYGWCWSRDVCCSTYDALSYEAWCMGWLNDSKPVRGLTNERYLGWSVRAVRATEE